MIISFLLFLPMNKEHTVVSFFDISLINLSELIKGDNKRDIRE